MCYIWAMKQNVEPHAAILGGAAELTDRWQDELRQTARPGKVAILSSFFKTGPGEYGEGDRFIGVTVPDNRAVARRYFDAPPEVIAAMAAHQVHEFRLSALLAVVERYRKARTPERRAEVVDFYLSIAGHADNWDLVDLSAPYILGQELLLGRHADTVRMLARDVNMWKQRIAVVATLLPVRRYEVEMALEICETLIDHRHELINKAVGWVLREVWKKYPLRTQEVLERNLGRIRPVTLSYAIERMTKAERDDWRLRARRARRLTIG